MLWLLLLILPSVLESIKKSDGIGYMLQRRSTWLCKVEPHGLWDLFSCPELGSWVSWCTDQVSSSCELDGLTYALHEYTRYSFFWTTPQYDSVISPFEYHALVHPHSLSILLPGVHFANTNYPTQCLHHPQQPIRVISPLLCYVQKPQERLELTYPLSLVPWLCVLSLGGWFPMWVLVVWCVLPLLRTISIMNYLFSSSHILVCGLAITA